LHGSLPNDFDLIFYDPFTRKEFDKNDLIRIHKDIKRKIKIIAGNYEFIKESIEKINAEFPIEFKLYDNYPNPFRKSTRIDFENHNHAPHDFYLFNTEGKLVKQLKDICDDYIELSGKNLESGLYIYRITGRTSFKGKLIVH
jgi:hypothetical protein